MAQDPERAGSPAPEGGGPAVVVEGVAKRFPLFGRRRDRLFALLGREGGIAHKTAIEDVSFAVAPGEALGVIGENGSGKSTLLRLVAGILSPDAGRVRVVQPVAAILELGLGLHPQFTGRENALFYGSLVGIPPDAMRERLEAILAFADLGDFIDQPLRTYSSGMSARLAFAVATNVDAEVLVVDEALAVGDGAFQKKCVDRMVRLKESGRTVLFCSHAMYLVTSFCERAMWLREGRVARLGPAAEVVEAYETFLMTREKRVLSAGAASSPAAPPAAGLPGRLRSVQATAGDGRPPTEFRPGDALEVTVEIEARDAATAFHVGVSLDAADGRCVFAAATHRDGRGPLSGATTHRVALRIPSLPIGRGSYMLLAFLLDEHGLAVYDQVALPGAVRVDAEQWSPALLAVDHGWRPA